MKKLITLIFASILFSILAVSCEDISGTTPAGDSGTDPGTETPTAKPWDAVASGEIVQISYPASWSTETSLDSAGEIDWYKFQADEGYYELNWQDSLDPVSTSMTGDIEVTAYKADGSKISGPIDNGMADGISFTKDSDYIYIKVEGKDADTTGTYSIFFS